MANFIEYRNRTIQARVSSVEQAQAVYLRHAVRTALKELFDSCSCRNCRMHPEATRDWFLKPLGRSEINEPEDKMVGNAMLVYRRSEQLTGVKGR